MAAPAGEEILLEEVEVLPYESVFDWTLQDPVGFYQENDRYLELKKQFKGDDLKILVIEEMWKDRRKYHLLRRSTWPPNVKQGMFYTRGHYGDYDSVPTVAISSITDKPKPESTTKRTKQYKNLKIQINDIVRDDDLRLGRRRKNLKDLPPQVKVVEMVEVPKDGEVIAAPITIMNVITPNEPPVEPGHTIVVLETTQIVEDPNKKEKKEKKKDKKKKSNVGNLGYTDFSTDKYELKKLEVKKIPEGTTVFYVQNMAPKGKVTMKPNKKTGEITATIEFESIADAEEAYKKIQNEQIKGQSLTVEPKAKKGGGDGEVKEEGDDGGKKKKKKKSKTPAPVETETVEVVTYETVKKRKSKKSKSKTKVLESEPESTDKDKTAEILEKKAKKKAKG